MDTFDDFLTSKIRDDKPEFEIENSRFNYLHSLVNFNSTKSTINRNSVFSLFTDFFSPRLILAKVAFISIFLMAIIGNKENKRSTGFILHADSTFIQTPGFDTLNAYQYQRSDSLYR